MDRSKADGYEVRCPGLPGISFEIAVFPGWEPLGIALGDDGCRVALNWPAGISYETPRLIDVRRVSAPVDVTSEFSMGRVRCFGTKRNTAGVNYGFVFDADNWVAGYEPGKGQWDYLQFYGKAFTVRVRIDGGSLGDGFDTTTMVQRIVDTFRFGP